MMRRAIPIAWLLIAAVLIGTSIGLAARANATPETDYLDLLNDAGINIYDTSLALSVGYDICAALDTTNGEVVASNLYRITTRHDIPDLATAETVVVIAGSTLCPWTFHPERALPQRRAV